MAKNLIGISLKGLTKRQKSSMNKHKAHTMEAIKAKRKRR